MSEANLYLGQHGSCFALLFSSVIALYFSILSTLSSCIVPLQTVILLFIFIFLFFNIRFPVMDIKEVTSNPPLHFQVKILIVI